MLVPPLWKLGLAAGCLAVAGFLNPGIALYGVSGHHEGGLPTVKDA